MSPQTVIWYRITRYGYKIEEVEAVRESENCLWVKWGDSDRRINKVSDCGHYYRTAEEALDALRDRATRRLAEVEAEAINLRQVLADMSP